MKLKKLAQAVAFASIFGASAQVAASAADFKVVGYFPSWQGSTAEVQYEKLTHINYSFLLPNADGSLKPIDAPQTLIDLVSRAHAENVKVGIAIGGWNGGNDSAFETLSADPTARANFISNVMAFINQYDLDGVDMDWEYPDPGQSAKRYTLLMDELSKALKPQGKFLTAAVVAYGNTGAGVETEVFEDIDFLNLMAYDANNTNHSTYQVAVESINYWAGRGLAKEKIVLGVPFYARPTWQKYRDIVAADPSAACRDLSGGGHYNGIPLIKEKTRLALAQAGGIMNWELTQDAPNQYSLLTAMDEVINNLSTGECGTAVEPTVEPSVTPTVTPTVTPSVTPTVTPSVEPSDAWSASSVYLSGDIVIHNGNTYEAKWWNQGTEPGSTQWGPWELISGVEPTIAPTVTPTAEPTVTPTVEPTIDPTVAPTIAPTVEPTIAPTVEPSLEPTVEPSLPPQDSWLATRIYLSGDRVSYKGNQYEAKWWTQGEEPGVAQWGPWKKL
ncbi:glycosyl hydrolase family 18 protein [Motilimonas sp. 1_MG-2023]|uniref:glycosyl hydrolase family 18 protein n=1 Tax=Motilimonas sp. 1_MG-2023 TaxID=3062672 RepID=UPI0026E2C952|nr:glycosyl hydrolase family 18 protein [Motilimonas sp. 1_MG-2023]MDO6527847.1 glycosyl hydrolase family 18 protein [Motilimonas sp. 1_MG-2023]